MSETVAVDAGASTTRAALFDATGACLGEARDIRRSPPTWCAAVWRRIPARHPAGCLMETERPERWRVDGEQLRAGVYALNDEVHIDAVEFCFGIASDRRDGKRSTREHLSTAVEAALALAEGPGMEMVEGRECLIRRL